MGPLLGISEDADTEQTTRMFEFVRVLGLNLAA
jgi:hypothetical protein